MPNEFWKGTNYIKPPIGIMPKKFWIEHRIEDLKYAIHRYLNANLYVPNEWYEELAEHIKELLEMVEWLGLEKEMIQNAKEIEQEVIKLKKENERLKDDNDRAYDILANIRDILLPLVNPIDNACGDMGACTVSNPECIKCLAEQIKGQFED